jgi:hypothetical protein
MSDTAAFFANKKKKKKAPFKFNANLIDANSVLVTEKVHVYVPSLASPNSRSSEDRRRSVASSPFSRYISSQFSFWIVQGRSRALH